MIKNNMVARQRETELMPWVTFPTVAAAGWRKILDPVRILVDDVLDFDGLFLLQLGLATEDPRVLSISAAVNMPPRVLMVPLEESDTIFLGALPQNPYRIALHKPSDRLKTLLSFVKEHGCTAALVTDLTVANVLWGCLVACSKEPRTYSSIELSQFNLLASHIATNLENRDLQAETRLRLSEALSLQNVSTALVEEQNLDSVLTVIINEATSLLAASDAVILLLDESNRRFLVRARAGPGLTGLRSDWMKVENSLNGLVVQTGKPLVSNEVMVDPRADTDRARRLNVRTVVIAPLSIHDETIGTIAVHNKRVGQFSRTDMDVLCTFANQAAVAIDNASLLEELVCAEEEVRRKACELQELLVEIMNIEEEERQRIASEIHDRVISRIIGASYEVEACLSRHRHSEDLTGRLDSINKILKEAADRTRASIYDLWPATLEHMGLLPALRQLFNTQERRSGIPHVLRVSGPCCELVSEARIAVYRIAQETLSNVRQHAAATRVDARIHFSRGRMRMIIRDNGIGFDVQQLTRTPPRRHFGLISMRERASGIGGSLTVRSDRGTGCKVVLDIPVDGTDSAEGREQQWRLSG